jgi:integrase
MFEVVKTLDEGMAANDTSGDVVRLPVPITQALIRQLAKAPASSSDRYIQDTEVTGFKLLRRKGPGRPRLSFLFIGRVRGAAARRRRGSDAAGKDEQSGQRGSQVLRITIGPAYGRGAISLAKARAEALRHLDACREGRNRVAELKERNAAAAAAADESGRRAQWTIAHAFADFLSYRHELGQSVEKMKLRDATQVTYRRCIRNVGALAKRPALEVSKAEIHDALMQIPTVAERAKVRRVLSLTIAHAFDRLGVEDRANPVSKLQRGLFAAPKPRETYIGESELGQWIERAKRTANKDEQHLADTARRLAYVLLLYGLRYSEAAKMEWSWFARDESNFTIPASVSKTKEARTLPVTPWMVRILEAQRNTCAMLKQRQGTYPRYVFPGRGQGERMKDIRTVMEAAGCVTHKPEEGGKPSFRPHDLRRTFATHFAAWVSDGARLKWILGHTAKDVTDKYIRPSPDQMLRDLVAYQSRLSECANLEAHLSPEQKAEGLQEMADERAGRGKDKPMEYLPV